MKIKIKVEKEIDVKYVEVTLPVNYEEEDMPNSFPMRHGGVWAAIINVDTGKISCWPQGKEGNFYMKVCDGGAYELLDAGMNTIAKIEDYVPNDLIPGEWGDYVNLKINKEGIITNWPENPDLSQFFPEDKDN